VAAVAKGLVLGMSAGAPSDGFGGWEIHFYGREFASRMGAITERLAG